MIAATEDTVSAQFEYLFDHLWIRSGHCGHGGLYPSNPAGTPIEFLRPDTVVLD